MARRISAIHRRKGLVLGQSENELARLIEDKLKIDVDPRVLRDFIRGQFVLISILAHEIHAQENQP